jgi:tRNA (mo5U34)-methyltransferase
VLGIDITPRYIQQANFVKKALSLENVRFEKRNLVTLDPAKDGTFDVVLCLGILYHLENPVAAMRKVAAVTGAIMLVDTDLIPNTRKNRPMWWMNFPSPSDVRSGSAAVSLWRKGRRMCQFSPNAKAVTELLKFLGFETVTQLPVESTTIERRYSEGRRGSFLAVR